MSRIIDNLREMLDLIHKGFSTLDLECARKVLQMDKEIDHLCHGLFQKHLAETAGKGEASGFDLLLMAQADDGWRLVGVDPSPRLLARQGKKLHR